MTSRVTEAILVLAVCVMAAAFATVSYAQEQEAASGVQKAEEKPRNPADDYFGKGMLYLMEGHGNELKAIENFEKVIEIDPSSYNTRLMLGKLYTGKRRYKDAEKMFRAAIEIRPKDIKGYDLLVSLLIFTNRPEKAVEVCEKAIEDGIHDKMLYDLGWAYYQAGMDDKAEARYKQELEFLKDKDLYAPNRNLGILYIARKDYKKALGYLEKAEEIGEQPKEVPLLMGMAYHGLDTPDQAQAYINEYKLRVGANYVKRGNKMVKDYFPHTTPPNVTQYMFAVAPDYDKRFKEAVEKGRVENTPAEKK